MGYKVIFAPQALEQLEEIVRFIAQDDPRAAERFGNYLVDRAELLADFPNWERRIGNAQTCDASCASLTLFIIVSIVTSR